MLNKSNNILQKLHLHVHSVLNCNYKQSFILPLSETNIFETIIYNNISYYFNLLAYELCSMFKLCITKKIIPNFKKIGQHSFTSRLQTQVHIVLKNHPTRDLGTKIDAHFMVLGLDSDMIVIWIERFDNA